jgi:hypothetical protein
MIGTQFTLYDSGDNAKKGATPVCGEAVRQELAAVCYDTNVLGFKGPRKMTVVVPGIADPERYIRAEIRPTSVCCVHFINNQCYDMCRNATASSNGTSIVGVKISL